MANIFERPIAANPMSNFEALPLEFMERAMQRRTDSFDKAKAEVEDQENSLLKLQYLSGDSERHHELQAKYDKELDAIVEAAGGDYSTIQGSLDLFSKRLKQEISTGELGEQQNAYLSAMKMKESEDKKLSERKSSQEGYNMFMESIANHRTTQDKDGKYTPFRGYAASTIVDPIKFVQDSVDEIHKNWDEEGMETRTPERIKKNFENSLAGNTNLLKAFSERVHGKVGSDGKPIKVEQYLNQVLEGVISDKAYFEVAKLTGANGQPIPKSSAIVIKDVGQPKGVSGSLTYTGGSSPLLKEFASLFGVDSWKEHNDIVSKPEMQKRIKYMEQKTGSKFPKGEWDQRNWLMDNLGEGKTSEISARAANAIEANSITNTGQLRNPNSAVYDTTGRLLKSEEVKAIQGSAKSEDGARKTSFISNIVSSGGLYPPGTMVMTSHNGKQYFVEPSDPEVINSPKYSIDLINMASETNTGAKTVTLRSNVGQIPMGTYEVEHDFGTGTYNLYQGGKLVGRKYTAPDGSVVGLMLDKKE